MKKETLQKKITPALLMYVLSNTFVIPNANAYVLTLPEYIASVDVPLEISGTATGGISGVTQFWVPMNTPDRGIYSLSNINILGDNTTEGPLITVLPGSTLHMNTDLIFKNAGEIASPDNNRITITASEKDTAAISVGVVNPDHDPDHTDDPITTNQTVFNGQYLDIINTGEKNIGIEGSNQDPLGNGVLTTMNLSDSTITAPKGIVWQVGDETKETVASAINLKNISMKTASNGLSVAAVGSGGSTQKMTVISDGLTIQNETLEAIALSGSSVHATMKDTTITSQESGIKILDGAFVNMTGETKIIAKNKHSTGQRGIIAKGQSQINIDLLNLEFESNFNGQDSGAVVATENSHITIGQDNPLASKDRSSINAIVSDSGNGSGRVYAINANNAKITLNHTDVTNNNSNYQFPWDDKYSTNTRGLIAKKSQIILNDSTIKIPGDDLFPESTTGAELDLKSALTLNNASEIVAGKYGVSIADSILNINSNSTIQAMEAAVSVIGENNTPKNDLLATVNMNAGNVISQGGLGFGIGFRVGDLNYNQDRAYLDVNMQNSSTTKADYVYKVNVGELNLNVNNSEITGAAFVEASKNTNNVDNIARVFLTNQSKWNFSQDPNTAATLGSTDVHATHLDLDNSEVLLSRPNSKADFQNLVVNTLNSQDGAIQLWTSLQDDNAASDKVVIRENTTGTTALRIMRFDSNDPSTDGQRTQGNGIKVVEAINGAQTSANSFILDKKSTGYRNGSKPSLVAGIYDYYLQTGFVDEPNSWYLSSVKATNPEKPNPGDPDPITPPVTPPIAPITQPEYRPEVDAYLSNRHQAVAIQQHRWQERADAVTSADKTVWLRLKNSHSSFNNQFSHKRKLDSNILHFGTDIFNQLTDNGSQTQLGIMALIGENKTKTQNSHLQATGRFNGYNLGLYGTWQQQAKTQTGLYLDGWLMQGWFKNSVEGAGLHKEKYDSRSLSVSLEAGYGFLLSQSQNKRFYLQPQAQVIWSKYHADNVLEKTGTNISHQNDDVSSYRLGFQFKADIERNNGYLISPFAEVNYWRMPTFSAMRFDHDLAHDKVPNNIVENTLGIKAQIAKQTHIMGRLSYAVGNQHYRSTHFQMGLKHQW